MGIKYCVDEAFFQRWNSTMAYVLGFIYADGSIYRSARGNYLAITSVDKNIIYSIKRWMKSEHIVAITKPTWPNGKLRYVLRIGNKKLYNDLLRLGVYPSKSLTERMPRIPRKFIKDFVRGNFDGDGCVHLDKSKGKKQKIVLRALLTVFTSGSKEFLDDLLQILKREMMIKRTKIYDSHRSFQLRLGTADSVGLFKFMYDKVPKEFFFSRKYTIFKNYFRLRPQRIDKKVQSILEYAGNGHVAKKLTQRSAKPLYMGANPIVASRLAINC